MSMSTGAYRRAAPGRMSSRRVIPQHLLGSVAVAGLVLGCAWTIYSNVLSAGIYPSMNNAAVDAHVVKLRQKLEGDPNTPRNFLTVHGVGYRFIP